MTLASYQLDFFGLKRELPVTCLSPRLAIANFNILGDIELTEKAGQKLKTELLRRHLVPDCFVGPEVKVVPFIHHMGIRFGHKRYVILRKSVRGYMTNPLVEHPSGNVPPHVKKLVLNGLDREYLRDKKVVLIDDVVSTGATMEMLAKVMQKINVTVLARCAIFKQGDRYTGELIYLAQLPIIPLP